MTKRIGDDYYLPEEISVYDVIIRAANAGLGVQREDGSFPAGYSYEDPLTPVRTTCNWLRVFLKAYEITDEAKFESAARDAVYYLLEPDRRPSGYTFKTRESTEKDGCNGLVGQYRPIKSLMWVYDALNIKEAAETAFDLFSLHPFCESLGLWERVDTDGTITSFDRTLNHQISFASAATFLLSKYDCVRGKLQTFLDKLNKNMAIRTEGIIIHFIKPNINAPTLDNLQKRHYNLAVNLVMYPRYLLSSEQKTKETSYHSINLNGLSILKKYFPEHELWRGGMIHSAVEYIDTSEYKNVFKNQISPWGDIPVGFGNARAHLEFNNDKKKATKWISYEIGHRFGFGLNSIDYSKVRTQGALAAALLEMPNLELDPCLTPPI